MEERLPSRRTFLVLCPPLGGRQMCSKSRFSVMKGGPGTQMLWSVGSGVQKDRLSRSPRRCPLPDEQPPGTGRGWDPGGGVASTPEIQGIWG